MMNNRKEFETKEMFFDRQHNLISRSDVYREEVRRPLQISVSVSTTNSVSFKQGFLNKENLS
jgi:hypothetical protein